MSSKTSSPAVKSSNSAAKAIPFYTLPSPPDDRDWVFEEWMKSPAAEKHVMGNPPPTSLDLRPYMLPIRDQAMDLSCVAHSAAAMKELQERVQYSSFTSYFSPSFLYCQRSNAPSPGMYLRDCCEILRKKGICSEASFPYHDLTSTGRKVPQELMKEAAQNVISGYALVGTLESMKQALFYTGPVMVLCAVYTESSPKIWVRPLHIPADAPPKEGYHCMLVVGYDEKNLIIRNSWGTHWGDGGHVKMPLAEFSALVECRATWDDTSPITNRIRAVRSDKLLAKGSVILCDHAELDGQQVLVNVARHGTADMTREVGDVSRGVTFYTVEMNDRVRSLVLGPSTGVKLYDAPDNTRKATDACISYENASTTSNLVKCLPADWQCRVSSMVVTELKSQKSQPKPAPAPAPAPGKKVAALRVSKVSLENGAGPNVKMEFDDLKSASNIRSLSVFKDPTGMYVIVGTTKAMLQGICDPAAGPHFIILGPRAKGLVGSKGSMSLVFET
jgi:Papain family cysteine protease